MFKKQRAIILESSKPELIMLGALRTGSSSPLDPQMRFEEIFGTETCYEMKPVSWAPPPLKNRDGLNRVLLLSPGELSMEEVIAAARDVLTAQHKLSAENFQNLQAKIERVPNVDERTRLLELFHQDYFSSLFESPRKKESVK